MDPDLEGWMCHRICIEAANQASFGDPELALSETEEETEIDDDDIEGYESEDYLNFDIHGAEGAERSVYENEDDIDDDDGDDGVN